LKIEVAKPPLFDEIVKVFPKATEYGVIFAWGDTIFNPSGIGISNPLRCHEEIHGERQRIKGVENWWQDYLTNQNFRYAEEVLSHIAEYRAQLPRCYGDRNRVAQLRMATARRLIAPLYNYEPKRALSDALSDLKLAGVRL
jgi:hypothetical protein